MIPAPSPPAPMPATAPPPTNRVRGPGSADRPDRSRVRPPEDSAATPAGPPRPPGPPRGDDAGRPVVRVSADEHRTNAAAVKALARVTNLYQRGDVLVRVVAGDDADAGRAAGIDRPADAPRIAEVRRGLLRELLAGAGRFVKRAETEDGPADRHVHPPGWCVNAVHERGDWPGVRRLDGIAAGPVLRADGSVRTSPGYDRRTRLFVPPAAVAGVPELRRTPTRDDAAEAVRVLLDVAADFPFAGSADRGVWLSLVVSLACRSAVPGPVPLHLLDANTPGSGKTLLATLAGLVALGRPPAATPHTPDDAETRKKLTAFALAGDPLVLIDNVGDPLGGPALDAALTAEVWTDRQLGTNRTVTLPMRAVLAATGNNVVLTGDIARRVLPCRLESEHERPEDRGGFARPDLAGWVRENRGRLVAVALTVPRAYILAGRPEPDGGRGRLGGFGGWAAAVRDALVWAGAPDPLATRAGFAEAADRTRPALAALLDGMAAADPAGRGLTAADILAAAARPDAAGLRGAVGTLCDCPDGPPTPHRLGNALRAVKGRVVAGRRLEGPPNRKGVRWFARPVGTAAGGGTGGTPGTADAPAEVPAPP